MFSVRTDDTGERACDENHLQHESERSEQQHAGKQSKHSALCVPPEMLFVLKMWLTFGSR
jgi:hypothetical protein